MIPFSDFSNAIETETIYSFGEVRTFYKFFHEELEVAHIASQSEANVLILGETGTGKEIIARSIHEASNRKDGPFLPINAGAIPKDLVASELFGFTEGAFTGARKGGAAGKFEAAQNGTLFLDEIGDMPLELQSVLLRAIESKKITRIGDTNERQVNARIIAATNHDLEKEMEEGGAFRADLFYRLNVLSITLPPLRDRPEDIRLLARDFLQKFHERYENGPTAMEEEAILTLLSYDWPGNIRELKNALERAFLLAREERSPIRLKHFPPSIRRTKNKKKTEDLSLKKMEKERIQLALQRSASVQEAARLLGIARSTLYRKLKEYNLA